MTMYAIIEDANGNEIASFTLLDSDTMDAEDFASMHFGTDYVIDMVDGEAPLYVVFREDNDNPSHIWSRHGFVVEFDE